MATSREQLTMDMSKTEFSGPSGCYISRAKGFLYLLAFGILGVAIAFITFTLTPSCEISYDTLVSSSPRPDISPSLKFTDVRLPTAISPLKYKIQLIPHISPLKNFTLEGKVWIEMRVNEGTRRVSVHVKNITIVEKSVTLREIGGENESYGVEGHGYDEAREFYNVTFDKELKVGARYEIYMEYRGILGDELAGFYRSSYVDKKTNETRWIGVTQFQATDARRAFPCFDEPHLKAEFEVSLGRLSSMTSLSNMNLDRSENIEGMDGWIWDHYNNSVPMSTYLVAFAVTDFSHLESNRSYSKPLFNVWAREDAIAQAEFSREIGPRILTYFEEYFNISFPLPKLDMIALPDFSAGAMENWGLITYRETAMLFDPKVSSDSNKQRVAVVISHEIAHQWFGNLVTPSWWSDLWLNEGFASYVEYIGVDHVFPEWKVLDQFVTDEIHDVFGLDALDSSHPISVSVHHPDEISELFDSISYAKGASIIRMMNHFLTMSTFNKGLTNYLNKWKYNSTEQNNLWAALTEQAHLDRSLDPHLKVNDIMDTWTLQKGFPVIQVERNYPQRSAKFTQSKFSLIRNISSENEYESYRWWVPISYATPDFNSNFKKTQPEFWISNKVKSLEHDLHANKRDWLIVNVQETGYYRVNYDEKNWKLIIDQLNENHSEIHLINRAQLLDDSLNLARTNLLSYELAFNLTQYLMKENEYLAWEAFLNNFQYISTMLLRSPSYGLFKKYMMELIDVQYNKVGFEESADDPLLMKYHRINILSHACAIGHKDCVSRVIELFSTWMNSSDPNSENPIPTNLRRIVYCNAIRYGGEKEWDFSWDRYIASNVATEKAIILSALACSRETWILNRYLQWSITPNSGIRKQDSRTVISAVGGNDVGNFLAFNFIREKWIEIKNYFSSGFSMGRVIKSISFKLNTRFELMELKSFQKTYEKDLASSTRAVEQSIEGVQANIEWMDKNFDIITKWLEVSLNTIPQAS